MILPLKPFTLQEYQQLVDKSVVLEQDGHGLKVLETPEGLIVKLFRQKRLISSALIKSYASRFVENAHLLKKLAIKAVEIVGLFYCKPIKRALVIYRPIPGETLRSVLQSPSHFEDVMEKFAVFFAELHDKGVFFRSIHFNNVIVSNNLNELGLIDFADMKITSRQLPRGMRLRNFKHLARYKVDQESIQSFGVERFMDIYFSTSSFPKSSKSEFITELQTVLATEGRV